MATAKINEKTMLNFEDIIANATEPDIRISSKGEATYETGAGTVVLKNINGIYSDDADNLAAMILTADPITRIHGNDAEIKLNGGIPGLRIILEDYFATNGKKAFTIGSYDANGAGAGAFVTDVVTAAFLNNANLYNEYNLAENHAADGVITASKLTGTAFNDEFDLTGFSKAQLKDAKGADLKNITIDAGAGNDDITGSVIDDVITGGLGANDVFTSGATNQKFGDDLYKLTKGEELAIDDGFAVQEYNYFTDGTNATIVASHQVGNEIAVNTAAGAGIYAHNADDTYVLAGAPENSYALVAGADAAINVANKYTFAADGTITKHAADDREYKTVVVGAEATIVTAGGSVVDATHIQTKAAVAANTYYDITEIVEVACNNDAGYSKAANNSSVYTQQAHTAPAELYAHGADVAYTGNTLSASIEYVDGAWQYKNDGVRYYTATAASGNQDAEHLVAAATLQTYIRYALTGSGDDYEGKVSEAHNLYIKDGGVFTLLTAEQCAALTRNALDIGNIASGTVPVMRAAAAGKDLYTLVGDQWTVTNPTAVYELAGTDPYTGKASAAAFLYDVNAVAGDNLAPVDDKMVYARYNNLQDEVLGTLTIDQLAKKQGVAADIEIKGADIENVVWTATENFASKNNYKGSWLSEEIIATAAQKAVTINAEGGNDHIYGSVHNDTISGGTGDNTIHYENFVTAGTAFGTDTVKLTSASKNADAEELTLNMQSVLVDDQIVVSRDVKGNDVNVDVLKTNAVINDAALNNAEALYKYDTVTHKYEEQLLPEQLYTDNACTVAYTGKISANIAAGHWTATLYDAVDHAVVNAAAEATADQIAELSRYTLDDILATDAQGNYQSLGTVTLKDLGKNNGLATVADVNIINEVGDPGDELFANYVINVDVTGTKKADIKATIGTDHIYSTGANPAEVTFTNAEMDVHELINDALYDVGGNANSFSIVEDGPNKIGNSVEFNNVDATFVDSSKAKYNVLFSSENIDLSEDKKANNLLYVETPTVAGLKAGADVKTAAGNDVVIFGSAPTVPGGQNTIDYVGGNDAYQGSAGKETYTVKSMNKDTQLIVNDLDGANDTLDFTGSGATLQKMTLFFDVTDIGTTTDGSLSFISNEAMKDAKSTASLFTTGKGRVVIDNYFTADSAFVEGAGKIENIKQDGAAVPTNLDAKVAAIAANVGAWLVNNGNYDSAYEVINAGNAADIQSLMLCYQAGTVA